MTLPTCAVVCAMHDQAGDPVPGAIFEATLNRFEIYESFVVPMRVTGTADVDGICTLDLWPNQLGSTASGYNVLMRSPAGKSQRVVATIPNQPTVNLHDVSTVPAYPGKPEGQTYIEEAMTASIEAQDAAATAVTAAATSTSAKDAALASQTAAAASATAAAGSATAASGSATAAAGSATAASGSATAASGSASAASASAASAAGAAAAAVASVAADVTHILPRLDNIIINGNFSVNQAALTSPVTLGAGARAHSCWKAGPFGATYSWTTTSGVTTLNITAGSLIQVIDGTDMPGGDHTAAWTGTAVGRFNAAAYGSAGVATANLPAGTSATLELSAGTVALVSMASGLVARPYPWRRLAEERALCEYRLPSIIANGVSNLASGTIISTGVGYVFVNLKETPRAHPTGLLLVGGAVGSLSVTSGVSSAALTGLTFLSGNDTRIAMEITWSGGPTSVGAAIYVNTSSTPTRLLFTGAEL